MAGDFVYFFHMSTHVACTHLSQLYCHNWSYCTEGSLFLMSKSQILQDYFRCIFAANNNNNNNNNK